MAELEKNIEMNLFEQYTKGLISACGNGSTEVVQLLLEKGADVNRVYKDRYTPLSAACSAGSIEIVQLLLENGADVNKVADWHTALVAAARF